MIDVSVPASPIEVGFFEPAQPVQGVAVINSHAYVANTFDGLKVIDVSDPSSPVEVGSHNTPGDANDLTVVGDYVYVADADAGMEIFGACGIRIFFDDFESGDTLAWSGVNP